MEENNDFLRMKISDPELIRKIQESGIESFSLDDINSLGVEMKDGHISLGDASQADLNGTNRIRLQTFAREESGPSPLKQGTIRFIGFMFVLLIVLSTIGIICLKMVPQPSMTNTDVVFLSLFFLVGLGQCLSAFHTALVAKKYLTERVQGKCISQECASGKLRTKRSIFEYTYGGKVYRSCESVFANKGYADVGEVRELMIAPENPRCIYDPIAGKARKIGGITIGMIFIFFAVVAAIYI